MTETTPADLQKVWSEKGFYPDDASSLQNGALGELNSRITDLAVSQVVSAGYCRNLVNRGLLKRTDLTSYEYVANVSGQTLAQIQAEKRNYHLYDASVEYFMFMVKIKARDLHGWFGSQTFPSKGVDVKLKIRTNTGSAVALNDGSCSVSTITYNTCPIMLTDVASSAGTVSATCVFQIGGSLGGHQALETQCRWSYPIIEVKPETLKLINSTPKQYSYLDPRYTYSPVITTAEKPSKKLKQKR
jgi:hypothetical protein